MTESGNNIALQISAAPMHRHWSFWKVRLGCLWHLSSLRKLVSILTTSAARSLIEKTSVGLFKAIIILTTDQKQVLFRKQWCMLSLKFLESIWELPWSCAKTNRIFLSESRWKQRNKQMSAASSSKNDLLRQGCGRCTLLWSWRKRRPQYWAIQQAYSEKAATAWLASKYVCRSHICGSQYLQVALTQCKESGRLQNVKASVQDCWGLASRSVT